MSKVNCARHRLPYRRISSIRHGRLSSSRRRLSSSVVHRWIPPIPRKRGDLKLTYFLVEFALLAPMEGGPDTTCEKWPTDQTRRYYAEDDGWGIA